MVCLSGRAFLIFAASVACAAKLHAGGAAQPTVATQEVNRCLSVVRAAARKGTPSNSFRRRDDMPCADPRPGPRMELAYFD